MIKTIFVGSNPGTLSRQKSPSMKRLDRWTAILGIVEYDFINVIDHHVKRESFDDVDEDLVKSLIHPSYARVFTLGQFADQVLTRFAIGHYPLPHPSPRNRLFNDPEFEVEMLFKLRQSGYLTKSL